MSNNQNWILTTVAMPKENGDYLITVYHQGEKKNKTYFARFMESRFWILIHRLGKPEELCFWTVNAIAWREMPEPFINTSNV